MSSDAKTHLAEIHSRIAAAAQRSGRRPETVTLVAVTKTVPYERIAPYLTAGITDIGENRVQEALQKYAAPSPRTTLHLIGPLQSNKARKAVQFFDMIQTLDRVSLAEDLDRHAREIGKTIRCLIEIKISPEQSKSGLAPEQLEDFLGQMTRFPHVKVEGLMGIPPATALGDAARPWFSQLRRLREETGLPILSMGMSSDFEVAIEEGSTMVRLGTALFGTRLLLPQ